MGSPKASFQQGRRCLPMEVTLKRGVTLRELKLALSQLNWHVSHMFHLFTICTHEHVPEVRQLILSTILINGKGIMLPFQTITADNGEF